MCCRSVDKCLSKNRWFHHKRAFASTKLNKDHLLDQPNLNISAPESNPFLTPQGQCSPDLRRLPVSGSLPSNQFENIPLNHLEEKSGQTYTSRPMSNFDSILKDPNGIANANYYDEPPQEDPQQGRFVNAELHAPPQDLPVRPARIHPPTPSLGRLASSRTPVRYYELIVFLSFSGSIVD
jgi:hypothetical protein